MLDLKFIRENPGAVKEAVKKKQVEVEVDQILKLDQERRSLLVKSENLKAKQNKTSKEITKASKENKQKLIQEMQEVAKAVKDISPKLEKVEQKLKTLLLLLPNIPYPDVPEGKDESENQVLRKWGKIPKFNFEPKDHFELGESLGLIDIERAAKVAGARFYYLKKEAVLLELALVQFAFKLLTKEGFIPVLPPVMVKEEIMEGGGYLPTGAAEIYKTERDNLYLVGTSEQSILGMHAGEILDGKKLPLRYVGFSSCFRREAGSYGKDVRGIFRVHQFDKVEMFSFCESENSQEEHEYFLSLEERIMKELKIPYQVVVMCAGDLGAPAAKKYDIEAWMPGEGKYRETHSTSNCTDFQARRLNIRYRKNTQSPLLLVHTINGTATAIGRMLIAILENYQNQDGSVTIPKVLRPYLGQEQISPSS